MKFTIPALFFALIRLSSILNTRVVNPELEQQIYLSCSNPTTATDYQYTEGDEEKPIEQKEEVEEELPASAKVTQKKIFKTIIDLLNIVSSHYPELTLRLNLQAV